MKRIEIVKVVSYWSEKKLVERVEETANQKIREGYEVINVSFVYGGYAYITIQK